MGSFETPITAWDCGFSPPRKSLRGFFLSEISYETGQRLCEWQWGLFGGFCGFFGGLSQVGVIFFFLFLFISVMFSFTPSLVFTGWRAFMAFGPGFGLWGRSVSVILSFRRAQVLNENFCFFFKKRYPSHFGLEFPKFKEF